MGTCGAKPNQNKKKSMMYSRKSTRPLSFIQQVLTVNGVKNVGDENQDPKLILKQFQQSQQGIIELEEKKVLLTEIDQSSILKRRQVNIVQQSQDDSKQNNMQAVIGSIKDIQQRKQRLIANEFHKKNQNTSDIYSNKLLSSGNELGSNIFQNQSTQNSLYQNFSNSQLNPVYQTRSISNNKKSVHSLEVLNE